MQRIGTLRDEAGEVTEPRFIQSHPVPALLLRFVQSGELQNDRPGPGGTLRHAGRRTLSDRLKAGAGPDRDPVAEERLALLQTAPELGERRSYLLGRDRRSDVVLNDYTISVEHARIHHEPAIGRWMFEDLGSTNRSRVNGEPLDPYARVLLTTLDELQLGRMVFMYLEPADLYRYLRGEYQQ